MPIAERHPAAQPRPVDRTLVPTDGGADRNGPTGDGGLSPEIQGAGPAIDLQRLLAQRIVADLGAPGPSQGSPAETLALDLFATRADVDHLEWLIASTSRAAGPILLAGAVAGLVMLLI